MARQTPAAQFEVGNQVNWTRAEANGIVGSLEVVGLAPRGPVLYLQLKDVKGAYYVAPQQTCSAA